MTATPKNPSADNADLRQCVERLDLSQLAAMLREHRGELSLRQAATAAGVSFSTFARVEAGSHQPDLTSFMTLCAWLGVQPSRFFRSVTAREVEPLEEAISHLASDPRLEAGDAAQIATVVRGMYEALAKVHTAQPVVACHLRAASVMRPGVSPRLSALLQEMSARLSEQIATGKL